MERGRSPREVDELLARWYSQTELEQLNKHDRVKLRQRIFVTAETILRRLPAEEAGSALAALRINYEVASNDDQATEVLLREVLNIFGDDRNREHFKVELRAFTDGA
jgi:hypothetical protein